MRNVVAVQILGSVANLSEDGFNLREGGAVSLIKIKKIAFGSLLKDENIKHI